MTERSCWDCKYSYCSMWSEEGYVAKCLFGLNRNLETHMVDNIAETCSRFKKATRPDQCALFGYERLLQFLEGRP